MFGHNALHNVEPKAGTFGARGKARLEDAGQNLGRNPGPVIADDNLNPPSRARRGDLHHAILFHRLRGVEE